MSDEQEKTSVYDEINRLLSRKEEAPKAVDESVLENFARSMRLADAAVPPEADMEKTRRVEPIAEPPAEEPAAEIEQKRRTAEGDIAVSTKTAKQRVADILNGMKKDGVTGAYDFDEPLLPPREHAMETDENRRRFLESVPEEPEEDAPDEGTKVIERPGFIVKKNRTETIDGLESIPTIVEAEDVKTDEDLFTDEKEEPDEPINWAERQIYLDGFGPETAAEAPEQISEEEAEQKLHSRRMAKVGKFRLEHIAENEGRDQEDTAAIERLLNGEKQSKKPAKASASQSRLGFEYTDEKNANRIRATLHRYMRLSLLRTCVFSVLCIALFALNLTALLSAEHDTTLIATLNLALLGVCIFVGREHINKGMLAIFRREPNMQSAVAAATFAALVQSICGLVAGIVLEHPTFSLAGCAAAVFAVFEYGEYLRHARTYDAFNFCTGKMKDRLYSIQKIEKELDAFEIGRNLLMGAPDIRYSCRAKRPARLIERCESEVSADKLQSLLLPIVALGAVICGVLGGVFAGDILSGVTAAAGAACVCVPAFGLAAIQLPMRWANKRLNKAGGLLTGQAAIEEYSAANAVVIDSASLFDPEGCRMHGFLDFNHVRIDDIMLYTAAMVIHSGGPLASVFDQVVSKRELLPEVTGFRYEDRMGISGWINGQKVFVGNRNMMRHHNFNVEGIDEEKYTHDGRRVMYVAIANSLAALLVVSYAPNKKILPFLKRLGTDGVTILLRNNDANVTTDLINETFGVRLDNLRMMSSTSSKMYNRYRTRLREFAKSGIIHDGTPLTLLRSFTMSYTLCGTFKVENLWQLFNVLIGILFTGLLVSLRVVNVVGMWPLLLFQICMTVVAILIARLRGIF